MRIDCVHPIPSVRPAIAPESVQTGNLRAKVPLRRIATNTGDPVHPGQQSCLHGIIAIQRGQNRVPSHPVGARSNIYVEIFFRSFTVYAIPKYPRRSYLSDSRAVRIKRLYLQRDEAEHGRASGRIGGRPVVSRRKSLYPMDKEGVRGARKGELVFEPLNGVAGFVRRKVAVSRTGSGERARIGWKRGKGVREEHGGCVFTTERYPCNYLRCHMFRDCHTRSLRPRYR